MIIFSRGYGRNLKHCGRIFLYSLWKFVGMGFRWTRNKSMKLVILIASRFGIQISLQISHCTRTMIVLTMFPERQQLLPAVGWCAWSSLALKKLSVADQDHMEYSVVSHRPTGSGRAVAGGAPTCQFHPRHVTPRSTPSHHAAVALPLPPDAVFPKHVVLSRNLYFCLFPI